MPRSAGALLVEIIIVVAIMALLAGAYLGLTRRGGEGEDEATTPAAAMDKARGVECATNLQQVRAMLQMVVTAEERFPSRLDPGSGINRCPVSNQPYSYDAQTGRAWCTTPGHEKF